MTIRQSAIRHVRRRHRLAIDELPVDWIRARRIVRIRDRVDHIPERIAVAIDMEVNILRVDGQPSIAARNRVVLEEILRLVADSRLEIIAADMVRLRVVLDITTAVIAVVIGEIRRLFRVAIRQAINQRDRLADHRTVGGAVVNADILRRDLQRRLRDSRRTVLNLHRVIRELIVLLTRDIIRADILCRTAIIADTSILVVLQLAKQILDLCLRLAIRIAGYHRIIIRLLARLLIKRRAILRAGIIDLDRQIGRSDDDIALYRHLVVLVGIRAIFMRDTATRMREFTPIRTGIRTDGTFMLRLIFLQARIILSTRHDTKLQILR